MTIPGLKPAYWADDVAHVQNAAGNPLFKQVELEWSTPTLWTSDMPLPEFNCSDPFLYALVRNHGNAKTKDHIVYIGLTTAPSSRFGNHPTAKGIVNRKEEVGFSYAPINFVTGKNKIERMSYALEQLEHLLIWAVDEHLENEKKMFTLPGMGANGGEAWHIVNTGYRFFGRMPQEIIYPWILVKAGRNRIRKKPKET
jgi:hypothetical protein